MAVFLSDEWIAALDGVLRAEQGLTECAAVTVEQTVVGTPSGDVRYRVVIDGRGERADRARAGSTPTRGRRACARTVHGRAGRDARGH